MNETIQMLNNARNVINDATAHLIKAKQLEEGIKKAKKKKILMIFLIYFASAMVSSIIANLIPGLSLTGASADSIGRAMSLNLILEIAVFVVGIIIFKKSKYYKKYDKKEIEKAIQQENQIATSIIEQNYHYLDFLMPEYQNVEAINRIASILETGRAETLNEALNIYDAQAHYQKVENMNSEILSETRRARKSANASAATSAANLIFNIASRL